MNPGEYMRNLHTALGEAASSGRGEYLFLLQFEVKHQSVLEKVDEVNNLLLGLVSRDTPQNQARLHETSCHSGNLRQDVQFFLEDLKENFN